LEADYQNVRQQVTALNERLPEKEEIPRLVQQLTDLSRNYKLELVSLRPQPMVETGDYLRLPLEINLGGSYRALGEYLQEIEALPRVVNLEEIEIQAESEKSSLNIRLILVAFALREKGEAVVGEK
jgi:type IV pilus assembly protein PilO